MHLPRNESRDIHRARNEQPKMNRNRKRTSKLNLLKLCAVALKSKFKPLIPNKGFQKSSSENTSSGKGRFRNNTTRKGGGSQTSGGS